MFLYDKELDIFHSQSANVEKISTYRQLTCKIKSKEDWQLEQIMMKKSFQFTHLNKHNHLAYKLIISIHL